MEPDYVDSVLCPNITLCFNQPRLIPAAFINGNTGRKQVDNLPGLLEFMEWTVPWDDSRPRDPYVAPDGTVWFVGQVGDYVAKLNP